MKTATSKTCPAHTVHHRPIRGSLISASAVLLAAGLTITADAQTSSTNSDAESNAARFSGAYWSQVYPKRDYDRGCAIGFLSFEFQPTGYFIFDRKVAGSWQVDELGNVKLRTKQGQVLKLIVHAETLQATSDLGLVKRANLYQKCPT